MSTFYHGSRTKFVLGTSPYYAQQLDVKKQTNPLTETVQTNLVVEPETKYHEKENLPTLDVDLKNIKKVAAADVVKDLGERVKPKGRAKRAKK